MIASPTYSYSPTEYLELEDTSEVRHTYIQGEIVPMAGETPNHNRIALNVGSILNLSLKDRNYDVFVADQRLWIPQSKIYTYPDVMMVEGTLEYQQNRRDTILNPVLIVEVLSKSTYNFDVGENYNAYRTIPSLQEYLLIDQYSYQVSHYVKIEPRKWLLAEYLSPEEVVPLSSVKLNLAVKDIYNKVEIQMIC